MASTSVIAARVQRSLEEIRVSLIKLDAGSEERLRRSVADGTIDAEAVPPFKQRDLVLAYLAESVATLTRLVDRELTPKKRGRPPKKREG
jgi:hypothetical protein